MEDMDTFPCEDLVIHNMSKQEFNMLMNDDKWTNQWYIPTDDDIYVECEYYTRCSEGKLSQILSESFIENFNIQFVVGEYHNVKTYPQSFKGISNYN